MGRSTFELATIFEETIGIDFSNAFIDCANQLKKKGELSYKMQVEGDINKDMVATVDLAVVSTRTVYLFTYCILHFRTVQESAFK